MKKQILKGNKRYDIIYKAYCNRYTYKEYIQCGSSYRFVGMAFMDYGRPEEIEAEINK